MSDEYFDIFDDFIRDVHLSQDQWDLSYNQQNLNNNDCDMFNLIEKESTENRYSESQRPSDISLERNASEASSPDSHSKKKQSGVPDNEKNRCAYITKKIVLFFVSKIFEKVVRKICGLHKCSYASAVDFYKKQLKAQFGINHLISLLAPEQESEIPLKKTFKIFMQWFLREKYVTYIVKNGKMGDKQSYIDYKNKTLLYIETVDLEQVQPLPMSSKKVLDHIHIE